MDKFFCFNEHYNEYKSDLQDDLLPYLAVTTGSPKASESSSIYQASKNTLFSQISAQGLRHSM